MHQEPLITIDVNFTRFNEVMARYVDELGLAPDAVVRAQAGLVMSDLASSAAPKNRTALNRQIDVDVGKVYGSAPRTMLPMARRQGQGFVWIMAGPPFLVGVKPNNYHVDDSVEDLKRLYHRTAAAGIIKGNRYLPLGTRGNQNVLERNRIIVKRTVLQEFKRWLKTRVGILGGSWATGWDVLKPSGRRPAAFKMRHVDGGTARGTYINGLGVPGRATFTLINRAAGAESRNHLLSVGSVLKHRAAAMTVDLKNILRGAYQRASWSKVK